MIKSSLPRHVAVIPDGNRRWAAGHGIPRWRGHLEGAKRVEEITRAAVDLKIKYFTLWGESYDNLINRPKLELKVFSRIHKELIKKLLKDEVVRKEQVRIRFIGEWPKLLDKAGVDLIRQVEAETEGHSSYEHSYLIGYNGDREMLDAINKLIRGGHRPVTDDLLKSYLWTADLPPVDLLIRTGGEPHLSTGFMMWHTRDAQFHFVDKLWPDFRKADFIQALEEYSRRGRRFGR